MTKKIFNRVLDVTRARFDRKKDPQEALQEIRAAQDALKEELTRFKSHED